MTSTHQKTSDISIIIPTLNEESAIKALASQLMGYGHEIVLVDGGSSDNTVTVAQKHGLKVLSSSPGRARQLNLGASNASGRILLFLHADTLLPADFENLILKCVGKNDFSAGAFSLSIQSATPSMRFVASCANLRSKYFQLPYGDQAIFTTQELFHQFGGFPETAIMEDYLFIKRAAMSGRIITLPEKVVTSSRRWEKLGVMKTTLINQLIVIGYHFKIPPEKLKRLYGP